MPANAEMLNYKKDGTPFWNELVIQPIVDGKGEYFIYCILHFDVTERKKDESLLKLQEKIFSGINAGVELTIYCKKYETVIESFFPTGSVCSILFKEKNGSWYSRRCGSVPESLLARNVELMRQPLETRNSRRM